MNAIKLKHSFSPHSSYVQALLCMWVSVFLFAGNTLLVKYLGQVEPMDFWVLSLLRSLGGVFVLALFFVPQGHCQLRHLVSNRWLVLRGVLGAMGLTAFYATVVHMDVGKATVINTTYALFASLFAFWFLKESLSLRRMLWMVFALMGMTLILRPDWSGTGWGVYECLAVLGALVAGVTVVIVRKLSGQEHYSTIFAAQCFYGLFFVLVPAVYSLSTAAVLPSALGLALALFSGVTVAWGQIAMTRAYRDLPVSSGAVFQMMIPVVTLMGGIGLFDERLLWLDWVGVICVLLGCYAALKKY